MLLCSSLQTALQTFRERDAFVIHGTSYRYSDVASAISRIRRSIRDAIDEGEKNVGLVANDDLETYASIIALWFEGKAYVPLSPDSPEDRNQSILEQASVRAIIDSSQQPLFPTHVCIASKNLPSTGLDLEPKITSDQDLAYLLFTSGTTGQPKGVPITRANLSSFFDAFWKIGFELNEEDKCLQMFELTFDLSVVSYVAPLLKGACVYTIAKDVIKYASIYELMDEQQLTFAGMVPSILHFLRPHFDEISFPSLKYNWFCGEALPADIAEQWSRCVPNARLFNVYGPTEDTIFCTSYPYNRFSANKSHNGVLSIGKPMDGTRVVIVDSGNREVPSGELGQLCLAGSQLTPGYWRNEEKNQEAFFIRTESGRDERFYKTGDLCYVDKDGDLMYAGRTDSQIKIQGFRVELAEIESHARAFLGKANAVAHTFTDPSGNVGIGLVIESVKCDAAPLCDYLKQKMPPYMIPKKINFLHTLPLNINGKIDRKKLEQLFGGA